MKLRRLLKERLARGHVELTLSLERASGVAVGVNRALVRGYVEAFRSLAPKSGLGGEPDLNAILKLPGALENAAGGHLRRGTGKVYRPRLEEAIAS